MQEEPTPPPLPPSAAPQKPRPLWQQSVDAHDDLEEGETREMRGIGGWLLLFTIGRFLAIPFLGFALFLDVVIMTNPVTWQKLTDPAYPAYDLFWPKVLTYETAGNSLFLLYSVVIVILLFSQRKVLRPLMVIYMVGLALFYWGDYLLARQISHLIPETLDRLLTNCTTATLTALVWVPYWLVSERVKGTFYR